MEKIFSHAWADKHGRDDKANSSDSAIDADGLQRKSPVDTTLLVHFFGIKGNVTLKYEDFKRYVYDVRMK